MATDEGYIQPVQTCTPFLQSPVVDRISARIRVPGFATIFDIIFSISSVQNPIIGHRYSCLITASGIARGVGEAVRDSDKSGKPGNEAGAAMGNAVRSGIQGAVDELLSTPGDVFNHMRNHPVRSGIELLFGVGPLIVDAKVEKLRGK